VIAFPFEKLVSELKLQVLKYAIVPSQSIVMVCALRNTDIKMDRDENHRPRQHILNVFLTCKFFHNEGKKFLFSDVPFMWINTGESNYVRRRGETNIQLRSIPAYYRAVPKTLKKVHNVHLLTVCRGWDTQITLAPPQTDRYSRSLAARQWITGNGSAINPNNLFTILPFALTFPYVEKLTIELVGLSSEAYVGKWEKAVLKNGFEASMSPSAFFDHFKTVKLPGYKRSDPGPRGPSHFHLKGVDGQLKDIILEILQPMIDKGLKVTVSESDFETHGTNWLVRKV
jgi:hypothetical protein